MKIPEDLFRIRQALSRRKDADCYFLEHASADWALIAEVVEFLLNQHLDTQKMEHHEPLFRHVPKSALVGARVTLDSKQGAENIVAVDEYGVMLKKARNE